MGQDLKLSEKLLCLAIDPTSGGIFYNASSTLNMTLLGLVFVELVNKGLISIENDVVHLVNPALQKDEIHEFILNSIRKRKKDQKMKAWISWLDFKGSKIKKLIIRSLVNKYVLRIEEKRFLFIPYEKVYLMDWELVKSFRKELESVLLGKTEPNDQSVILAQMAAQNNLLAHIVTDKAKRKEATLNLKKFPQTQLSKAIQQAIYWRYSALHAAST